MDVGDLEAGSRLQQDCFPTAGDIRALDRRMVIGTVRHGIRVEMTQC